MRSFSALMGAEKERDALEKRRASYESMVSSVEAREIELREELRNRRAQLVKLAGMNEEGCQECAEKRHPRGM